MQFLRDQLALVDGFTAVRQNIDLATNVPILALVGPISEQLRPRDTLFYQCDLRLRVGLQVRVEDADPVLDASETVGVANAFRYIDRQAAKVHRAVHAAPWPTGVTMANVESVEFDDAANERNELRAELVVVVSYRHNFDDPDLYNPVYVNA